MTKTFKSLSSPSPSERIISLSVNHETSLISTDLISLSMEVEVSSSSFVVPYPLAPPLKDLPLREELNRIRAGNHGWDDLSYSRIRRAHDKLDTWDSKYWAVEMRGDTLGIPAFNTPSIPIRPRKSRRLSKVSNRSDAEVTADPSAIIVIQDCEHNTEGISLPNKEENATVRDGSQNVSSVTDPANMQRADDASTRGSVLDKLNEPKGLGDASRSKGKRKVDLVDKKAEKNRIAAKAKADFKAGWITAFWIGGTCVVPPPEAPVYQSLGVTPPASAPISLDSSAIPLCPAVQTAINVSHPPLSLLQHKAPLVSLIGGTKVNLPNPDRLAISELLSFDWSSDIIGMCRADSWEATASENQQSLNDLFDQANALKEEKQKLEEEVKKRDAHLEAASAEVTLYAQEEVKAQLYYRRGAWISLEKMVEAKYELLPGLLENYAK
ncbi:hypothetical protein AALP_AA7G105000 [Arabis alpina]|uniref:Uncharacterized protein n=1 Tax=Arabis alpina TaxID=50452 RepID=A0A087GH69_ARAAL|nr:hypothetical protein AALP_AA7G105000 [Arabis alpina]